jgi:CheY-like chemotaxis protein
VQEIAEHESWEVENCIDGDAALEELVGHAQYDLLLVNFELPVLNGLELMEQVRTMPHRQCMPIVMMWHVRLAQTHFYASHRTLGCLSRP